MNRLETKQMQVQDAVSRLQRCDWEATLRVGQIMTAHPNCVLEDASVLELVKLFHAKHFRHLPVVDRQDRLVGIISDRDVLGCFGVDQTPQRETLAAIPASRLMSTDLITVGPEMSVARALELMIEQGISSLPVLVEGVLVGILTNTDLHVLLRVLLESATGDAATVATAELPGLTG